MLICRSIKEIMILHASPYGTDEIYIRTPYRASHYFSASHGILSELQETGEGGGSCMLTGVIHTLGIILWQSIMPGILCQDTNVRLLFVFLAQEYTYMYSLFFNALKIIYFAPPAHP